MRSWPSGEEAYPRSSSRRVSNSSRRALLWVTGLGTNGIRFDGTTGAALRLATKARNNLTGTQPAQKSGIDPEGGNL